MAVKAEIDEIIANNALKYDLLPYESKPFAQSQPARLAAMAKIFGLGAKPIANSRVLELGCAAGGNIMPLAMQHPAAEFVGVDLSRKQVAAGRAKIEKLGLKNFELHCKSFTELGDEVGVFDYIICHGVFSWVPRPVQDAIFSIIKQRLAPEGVAYVSYNVLPGWRMIQPLRDAFLNTLPQNLNSTEKVAAAVELLQFLRKSTPDKGAYSQTLSAWADKLGNMPLDYVGHEFLEDSNDPCTFREFMQRAGGMGLGYLGDSDLHTMIADHYPPETAAEIRRRSGNEIVATEQMMDLLSGRTFRQTLLVHQAQLPKINRNLSPDCLDSLHLLGVAGMQIKTEDGQTRLIIQNRQSFNIGSETMRKAVEKFIANYPSSSEVSELVQKKADLTDVKNGFYSLLLAGAITAVTDPVKAATAAPTLPKASKLAVADANSSAAYTTNLRHEVVNLDAASRFMLQNMLGRKNKAEIISSLVEEGRAGRIVFYSNGKPAETPDDNVKLAEAHAQTLMSGLAQAALLVG